MRVHDDTRRRFDMLWRGRCVACDRAAHGATYREYTTGRTVTGIYLWCARCGRGPLATQRLQLHRTRYG